MKHLEDAEQEVLFQWAAAYNLNKHGFFGKLKKYLFAIPNGGNRNPREAKRLKSQGVKSGVSDVFLPVPVGAYHGLWVEMKKPKDKFRYPSEIKRAVTRDQMEWLDLMGLIGYKVAVCYGFDEAKTVIIDYLDGKE